MVTLSPLLPDMGAYPVLGCLWEGVPHIVPIRLEPLKTLDIISRELYQNYYDDYADGI